MRYFKVGGLRFLRLGRLQISWCMVRRRVPAKRIEPVVSPAQSYPGWHSIEV